MSRRVVFPLLASALSLLLALTLAELLVRLAPDAAHRATPAGERFAWTERGEKRVREQPRARAKSPGVWRLVTIGDSFTWGEGVYPEDSYPRRLLRRLAAPVPLVDVDLVNWSRPGWNTVEELRSFSREIDLLAPDLAILGFCLNDAERRDSEAMAEQERLLGQLARNRLLEAEPAGASLLLERVGAGWRAIGSRRRVRAYYRALYEDEVGWGAAQRALAGFARVSREHSIPFLMVIFPIFDSQLDHRYPYRDLHSKARHAGTEAGLAVLDLLPFYEGIDARRLAVTPFTDPHPNELAHRIAADVLAAYLEARDMTPQAEAGGRARIQ